MSVAEETPRHQSGAELRVMLDALTALKRGDFSTRLPTSWTGLSGKVGDTFNEVMDQLQGMTEEIDRVSHIAGKKGRIRQRANSGNLHGSWAGTIESVNSLIADLVHPTSEMARVIGAVAAGDLSQQMPLDLEGRQLEGEFLRTAKIVNRMVNQLGSFASEVTRVAREVGTDGKLGGQAAVKGVAGTWKDLTVSVNSMAGNLTAQMRNIAEVTTAVANGDLSKKITVDVRGEFLKLKDTINTMVDQLRSFASEVTRVAREVGTEGRLGGQARVEGVSGTWKDLTDSVNFMASNLTSQVRNIAEVTKAVANGDLTKQITVDVKGEILELKNTINTMVDQLSSFAAEVTRVAREVGTEGKLGGQAQVKGISGTWKDLTDNVNFMAGNLTSQVRNIAEVTKAVASGDLSKKITVDVKGEILELKATINTMVDQLSSFAAEVTRVAREVGTEGKLGGQAEVTGVAGTWKDLTDNVNFMAGNLTSQVRNIAEVTTAVANGDLSKKIEVDVRGEILELKNTINTMVDQLRAFASEVTRVAREVGTEGELGGQADVSGVEGTWRDLTDSVNSMARNLTGQVRNIAEVTTAVATGDLSKKITVDVRGEILELKNTINTMVDQLRSFASEVTRVAREVGTEGKLGGQAEVKGVAGTWKDLTDNVNFMAGNLTSQVRNIAAVTKAVASGDLSTKISVDVRGEILELKDTINTMVDQLRSFASEVTRVAREVGTEGKLGGQAEVRDVAGTWKDLTDSVNSMAGNLTSQVRNIAEVTKAVASGDLSKKITVDVKGEISELKNTINTMVDQLSSFASEVTRVAREVGTEGKLGGQAQVKGVSGTWKDLTDNVNFMAGNLTSQVRGIARVVTSVANGDLNQKLTLEAKGEIAALADTINGMNYTLATFADQVTTVAREVGFEGKLGGQASVPGAAGTWKNLTDNVNQLAANLTTQVRAIAEVATAVTKGDLTRSIKVDARGEVAALKDNINEMIVNLKDTTLKNSEQDWLKTNLAKFSRMLQGQKDMLTVGRLILSELAPVVSAQHGVIYLVNETETRVTLSLLASYAYEHPDEDTTIPIGKGLVGQCAVEKRKILLTNVPPDYIHVGSGLGSAAPANVIVLPILFEGQIKAVLELASFDRFNPTHLAFLDQLMESIGIVLNTIEANMRTERLLTQSQSLARELQSRQEELQQTNQELQEKARLLAHQNEEVERKNHEVELARQALEEKAEQLALTSKYKSEFLANMSHELRTPLNSLLILSDQLSKNPDGNLSGKQTEYAKTIHSSGNDLLMLINDILDLSKIESGTVVLDVGELRITQLETYVERTFRHMAESKNLEFLVELSPELPATINTDSKRLQQVIKNLLSNAFKFTHHGRVALRVQTVSDTSLLDDLQLRSAGPYLAFSVTDTGIGISQDAQRIIFEAFQQADGSTSRKYGGTGLGLAISRELARLLGGEIRLASVPGEGSTFTLVLPQSFAPQRTSRRVAVAPQLVTPSVRSSTPRLESPQLVSEPQRLVIRNGVADDREVVRESDMTLLIVENDLDFARLLLDSAHDAGFQGLTTESGAAAVALAKDFQPSAVFLDISLPDIDGWRVLKRIKHDPHLCHIPTYILSTVDEPERGIRMGAQGVLGKPIPSDDILRAFLADVHKHSAKRQHTAVVVANDEEYVAKLRAMIEAFAADLEIVETIEAAIAALRDGRADCLIVSEEVSDTFLAKGFDDPERFGPRAYPILLYPERDPDHVAMLRARWANHPLVTVVGTRSQLAGALTKAFGRALADLPEAMRDLICEEEDTNVLASKRVLIVDDDIRNIFALTSILERYDMQTESAETGRAAIQALRDSPPFDIVLMDIMMPEMDGLDTTRAIRKIAQLRDLPIIAVTAKAMKGDRERCLEAGAWDYLSKPVEAEQLLLVLRAWLAE
jgi:HAMP domain-containing protein/signal transduction histidine kinase/DNA-binding response OmpR family regulator